MKEMNKDEFKDYCNKFDDNITNKFNTNKFKIVCQKCKSDKIALLFNGKEMAMGSEYTGAYTVADSNLVFKCIKCGNAMSIKDID